MSIEEFRFCYNEWIKKVSQSFTHKFNVNSFILFIILCFRLSNGKQLFYNTKVLPLLQIVQPRSALIVVDVQNDFIAGSLSSSSAVEVGPQLLSWSTDYME